MKCKVLKLGTECLDTATQLIGTLTHWTIDLEKNIAYLFQPRGLGPDGQPIELLHVCAARLLVQEVDYEVVRIPFQILGTQVEDKASGFAGMAISFIYHINGCFHANVQPTGTTSKGNPVASNNFDLRALKGEKIKELDSKKLAKSKLDTPSPQDFPQRKFGA